MALNLSGIQAGTVQSNDLNEPNTRVIRGKNMFPQSFYHPSSCRYGEVDPVFFMRGERGDTIPYRFATDLNTFTMASPMKSSVNMYSAAFKIPLEAIYPRNYEIMYPVPNKGDDAPEDCKALFTVYRFNDIISGILRSKVGSNSFQLAAYVRGVLLMELMYSAGSLFSKANIHLDAIKMNIQSRVNTAVTTRSELFDVWFDTYFAPKLREFFDISAQAAVTDVNFYHLTNEFENDRPVYYVVTDDNSKIGSPWRPGSRSYYISFRRALELLRTGEYDLNFESSDDPIPSVTDLEVPIPSVTPSYLINIENIIAYQLACAHFFTNSKVDYVYDAKLWRDNMQSLFRMSTINTIPEFDWNGITKQYDIMSQKVFDSLLSTINFSLSNFDSYFASTSFLFNLFSFQKSLRYGDYFTGSRPEPIAPGDINAPVVDGSVNALVMTRKLQFTRFLNKVNISGPRLQEYLTFIFGGRLPQAPKDVPVRLSVERFNVSGFEVNNTGQAQLDKDVQNITTTNLRLDESRYMFEAEIEEPCIIVAVQYFDAHRIYSKTLDRFALHYNRFDDFIPDMQFTGDQDVKSVELDITRSNSTDVAFAYNLRYMEYKSRYSYSSGMFSNQLKSWALVTDNTDGNPSDYEINPEYIRSSPSEFDRFYKSLTGYSLGTYCHFLTFNTNIVAPYRQMVYAPEILA